MAPTRLPLISSRYRSVELPVKAGNEQRTNRSTDSIVKDLAHSRRHVSPCRMFFLLWFVNGWGASGRNSVVRRGILGGGHRSFFLCVWCIGIIRHIQVGFSRSKIAPPVINRKNVEDGNTIRGPVRNRNYLVPVASESCIANEPFRGQSDSKTRLEQPCFVVERGAFTASESIGRHDIRKASDAGQVDCLLHCVDLFPHGAIDRNALHRRRLRMPQS